MILGENKADIEKRVRGADRALDVGGWFAPLNIATHVIDIYPYDSRKVANALFPEKPDRFDRDTWTVHDVMQTPWPFPDKYFDFCFCSHLLEDLADPISACHEMMRVSKAGYIETPSRVREIFTKERLLWLRGLFGIKPQIGDPHHHWLVEIEGAHIRFTRKTDLVFDSQFCLSRTNVGRKLTSMESGACLWWEDTFTCNVASDPTVGDLADFKDAAIVRLRAATSSDMVAQGAIRETRRRSLFLAIADKLPRLLAKPQGQPIPTLIGSWEVLRCVEEEVGVPGSSAATCRWIVIGGKNNPDADSSGKRITIDSARYRSNLVYRFRTNLVLRQLQASLAVCCTDEPDPMVEYAVLAAVSANERYVLPPRLKERFRDDGAYYLNRFTGTKPRAELIKLLATPIVNL